MNVRTEAHRSVDLPTGPGTELRITLAGEGEESTLHLAHGYGAPGKPFRRPPHCGTPINLPASIIPVLREALEALERSR